MKTMPTPAIVEQPFWPVKSDEPITFGTPPDSMIHHKSYYSKRDKLIVYKSKDREKRYGVSYSRRILSPQLLFKKFDYVCDCLRYCLGLTKAEREVILRLLRLWVYYGEVYPKETQITTEPGCSKATFWRTIRYLKDLELITTVPRFRLHRHAQISNLYRLDKLVILIARYLAERIAHVWPDWTTPILTMPAREFYHWVFQSPEARAGPYALALGDPGFSITEAHFS